jgi:hypothetical protein
VTLGGLLGVLWWFWPAFRGRGPRTFKPSFGRRIAFFFLGLLIFGAVFRTAVAIQGVGPCPGLTTPTLVHPPPRVVVNVEKALTWAPTGLGMAYAQLRHGYRCYVGSQDLYFDEHHHSFFNRKNFTIGDVFLSKYRRSETPANMALFYHERHHRRQWAIATVIGGTYAFPLAYNVDDFFYPASKNHFEREAGLARGGYDPAVQSGPKLGGLDISVLVGAVVVFELFAYVRRRRRPRAAGAVV